MPNQGDTIEYHNNGEHFDNSPNDDQNYGQVSSLRNDEPDTDNAENQNCTNPLLGPIFHISESLDESHPKERAKTNKSTTADFW